MKNLKMVEGFEILLKAKIWHVRKYSQPLSWHWNWIQVHPLSTDHPSDVFTTWLKSICGHFNFLDLESHTSVYIRFNSWQCMSEHKLSHKAQEIVCRVHTNDVLLKVPMAHIICKGKTSGITRTLFKAGHPANLSDLRRKDFGTEVIKNLMVNLTEDWSLEIR